jgi:hypothetical protein
VPNSVDRHPVPEVLGAAFHESHEGDGPEQVQRWEHGESEDVERGSDAIQLPNETKRYEGAGQRKDVHGGARGALAHGLRPRALEREVFCAQRREQQTRIGRLSRLFRDPVISVVHDFLLLLSPLNLPVVDPDSPTVHARSCPNRAHPASLAVGTERLARIGIS